MEESPEQNKIEWEIILTGNHEDICVIIQAPEGATNNELLYLAEEEALRKTSILQKKKLK